MLKSLKEIERPPLPPGINVVKNEVPTFPTLIPGGWGGCENMKSFHFMFEASLKMQRISPAFPVGSVFELILDTSAVSVSEVFNHFREKG